jgi:hypothetical protein
MKLIKDNGEITYFDSERFKESLMKSGASEAQIDQLLVNIKPRVYEGMKTRELYQMAHEILRGYSDSFAARYSLKKALIKLGPAGYYFEKWLGKFLPHFGYRTMHSQLIKGHAVTHEADVIAEKNGELIWIECKFRNTGETKISVTTPMYVVSRVKDISEKKYRFWNEEMEFSSGMLVTNSYFTNDSIDFANYYGLGLLSWDYPKDSSLKNLVDSKGLYPITCLTTLTEDQISMLLSKGIILVKELKNRLKDSGLKDTRKLEAEIDGLLKDCDLEENELPLF